MTTLKKLHSIIFILSICLIFFSCSDEDPVNIGIVTLQTNSTLGEILVDGNGKTLYFFTKDANGQSQCTAGCLTNWPVYYAPDLQPGAGIDADDFTTFT